MGTLTYLQAATDTTDTNVYTFASQNLGAADAGRYIIVTAVARKATTGFTLTGITIGGVAATIVKQVTNSITNSDCAAMVIALVPTGTTGDIVVTWSTTVLRCAIGVWRATGLASATPHDSDSSTAADPTVNLDVPVGFAIGGGLTSGGASATWTGLTEKYDATLETYVLYTGASDEFASSQSGRTMTIDFNSSVESAGVFASWAYETATPANDERAAKLTGQDTANSQRSAKIKGKSSTNSERSAKLTGNDPDQEFTVWNGATPDNTTVNSGAAVSLGIVFRTTVKAIVRGGKYYRTNSTMGSGVKAGLYNAAGTKLAEVTFTGESDGAWAEARFSSPVEIEPDTNYTLVIYNPSGKYLYVANKFASQGYTNGILTAPINDASIFQNGYVFAGALSFPTGEYNSADYGIDVIVSGLSASSGTSTNDERAAKITGKDTSNSERAAVIKGKDTSTSERSSKISGTAIINTDRNAVVIGKDNSNSERQSKITGIEGSNDERTAKTHGVDTTNSERSAKIVGKNTLSVDYLDIQFSPSAITVSDERAAKIHGIDTANSERPAKIVGSENDTSERAAKLTGVDTANSERPAKIVGQDTANDERSAKTTGKELTADERPAKLHGVDTENSERSAKVRGELTEASERAVKLHGKADTSEERQATLKGQSSASSEAQAKTRGKQDDSSERSATIHGQNAADSEIQAKVTGQLSTDDERAAKLRGKETDTSERQVKLQGQNSAFGEILAKIRGSIATAFEVLARIVGKDTASAERDTKITGKLATSDERALKIHGKDSADSERTTRLHGKDSASSERGARLVGKIDKTKPLDIGESPNIATIGAKQNVVVIGQSKEVLEIGSKNSATPLKGGKPLDL